MKTVTVYTDGACSGNPGPGGWCAILEYQGHEKMISGGEPSTTNNRMELMAVIQALLALREPCVVELYSDSKYVIDALEKGWAWGWRRRIPGRGRGGLRFFLRHTGQGSGRSGGRGRAPGPCRGSRSR